MPEDVEALGGGWVAEEALAIGVCFALAAHDVRHGLLLAELEARDIIEQVAQDLADVFLDGRAVSFERYPPA